MDTKLSALFPDNVGYPASICELYQYCSLSHFEIVSSSIPPLCLRKKNQFPHIAFQKYLCISAMVIDSLETDRSCIKKIANLFWRRVCHFVL